VTRKRRGRPPRVDTLPGWLRRTLEVFEKLETPAASTTTTKRVRVPAASEEVVQAMKDESEAKEGGPETRTRARRANGGVDRGREHLDAESGEEEQIQTPIEV
jgi:hypothetical protein